MVLRKAFEDKFGSATAFSYILVKMKDLIKQLNLYFWPYFTQTKNKVVTQPFSQLNFC